MNRLIHTRLSLALAIAFGICIAELSSFVVQEEVSTVSESAALTTNAPAALPDASTGNDTCVPPLLPLVVVRPTDQDLMLAETSELLAAISVSTPVISIPDLLPRVRLDMPYYSFGKLMPGATKE